MLRVGVLRLRASLVASSSIGWLQLAQPTLSHSQHRCIFSWLTSSSSPTSTELIDPSVGHPSTELYWHLLQPKTRRNWAALGWNRQSWDSGANGPASASKCWHELTELEIEAATELGENMDTRLSYAVMQRCQSYFYFVCSYFFSWMAGYTEATWDADDTYFE